MTQSTALAPPPEPGPAWLSCAGATCARLNVIGGVCVVSIDGNLDAQALQPCRAALDAALELHPSTVVMDLHHSAPPVSVSVALLSAARRYLRSRGVAVTLAGVPEPLMTALRAAHVEALYDVEPTAELAVAHVGGGPTAG